MNPKIEAMKKMIDELALKGFYGVVKIIFESGNIVNVKRTESIKLPD